MLNKAVFLDRDGTINVEKNYLYKIDEFEFIEGVPESIKKINDKGYLVIVITNQAGIARGYYTEEDVQKLHEHISVELKKYDAHIDDYFICPHHPSHGIGEYKLDCDCRKPGDKMLRQAVEKYNIDPKASVIVGDKLSDVQSGKGLGIRGILVRTGHKLEQEELGYTILDTLADVVNIL